MSLDLGETILQLDRVTRNLGRDHPDRRSQLAQLLRDAAAVTPAEAQSKTERFYDPFLAAQVTDTLLGEVSPPPARPTGWPPRWTAPTLTWTATCPSPATCSTWAAAS